MTCKYCNSQIKGDEKFCPYCGKQFGVPESWKCPQCNMNVREGTKYCPNCGSPIGTPSNNDFKNYAQNAFDRVKKVDWNEKKEGALSFIKEFINSPEKLSLATKVVAILFTIWFLIKCGLSASISWYIIIALILYVAFMGIPNNKLSQQKAVYASAALCIGLMLIVSFGTSKSEGGLFSSKGTFKSEGGLFSSKSPQKKFMEIIDKPETSYMVEFPNRIGEVYEHTLIFFPQNQEKTSGRAIIEPWTVGKNSWLDGDRYDYEIRDNHVELFNGKSIIGFSLRQLKDLRFTIEEGEKGIQLRGMYRDEERIFKLNSYRDKANKEKHNTPIY